MKKILLFLFLFLFLSVNAQALKGGISENYIPKGFFGSWGVISKLSSSNNPDIFNYESRDVWMLSGYENTLVLENLETGARSEIVVKDKSVDGKTLKFQREKIVNEDGKKVVYKETVSFVLYGNNFSGTDDFVVKRYNSENQFVKKDSAKYTIVGVRISGTNPKFCSSKE